MVAWTDLHYKYDKVRFLLPIYNISNLKSCIGASDMIARRHSIVKGNFSR
jgi:hypothetical protein